MDNAERRVDNYVTEVFRELETAMTGHAARRSSVSAPGRGRAVRAHGLCANESIASASVVDVAARLRQVLG